MLISFPLQGYGMVSIFFSTLSILQDTSLHSGIGGILKGCSKKALQHYWFRGALLFNVISSYGAFSLAYMMANHIMHQKLVPGS
jgi:hypothetical protein